MKPNFHPNIFISINLAQLRYHQVKLQQESVVSWYIVFYKFFVWLKRYTPSKCLPSITIIYIDHVYQIFRLITQSIKIYLEIFRWVYFFIFGLVLPWYWLSRWKQVTRNKNLYLYILCFSLYIYFTLLNYFNYYLFIFSFYMFYFSLFLYFSYISPFIFILLF